ncbi:type I secretion system permease/ATPase [Falsiroseomonas sp. CW058]|uniref:type I secretion system permease/ATPase n=1 Tax=Falsiroseomonas sp. CW058 TaxID=3388664 RepID=UPI003D312579
MVSIAPPAGRRRKTELDRALAACRANAGSLLLFSLGANLLLLASPLYMLQVYDRVMVTGRVETLVLLTLLTCGALLVFGLIDALRGAILARTAAWLGERLGPPLLGASVRARLHGDTAGAQPLRDLQQVQAFVSSAAVPALFDAPWTPAFLVLIWILHPWLGMLAVGSAVLLLLLGLAHEWVTRGASLSGAMAQIVATQQAEATIRNAEAVRAMGMLPALLVRWERVSAAGIEAQCRGAERGAMLLGLAKFLRIFVQSAVLGLGAYLVLLGEATGGVMIASSILLGRALAPVEGAIGALRGLGLARVAWGRLQSKLQAMPPPPERMRLPSPAGALTLDRVTYNAAGGRGPILQGVTFRASPGEAVAVIGPSAGGKSTLCRLITGILDPSSGEVRLDGSEIRHWEPEQLGRYVGYLPQDVELFAGTVRENIARMGTVDDAAVAEAARLAHAHEMIQRLPQGYDTQIGEGGARLSGGQRQRIGLARALYGVPRLIVLDEPNANLDQAGEAALSAAIEAMKGRGATLLIVGHRPSTIAQADRILVLKDGRVERFGTRDEVLKVMRVAAVGRAAESAAVGRAADAPPVREEAGAAGAAQAGGTP